MRRSQPHRRNLLLAVTTVVLVGSAAVVVYRVLRDEHELARPAAPGLDLSRGSEPQATAGDLERVNRAVGAEGLVTLAVRRYHLHMLHYPADLQELATRPESLARGENWGGPYINTESLLQDPWGRLYQYACPGVHNLGSYDLWSNGPDGVSGTEDDIGNW